MLYRKLLMAGAAGTPVSTHWILPGGRIFGVSEGGELVLMDPDAGWPRPTDGGDPFIGADGRPGFNVQRNHGGGVGEVVNVRLDRKHVEHGVRSLGQYRGWASERVSLGLSALNPLGPSGHHFPSWTLAATAGGSIDTGPTAGWPWEMQDNGDQHGRPTIPVYMQTIQRDYIAGMAYPSDACAARDVAVLTRLVADVYSSVQARDPATGRQWLGWTMDAAGVPRRIADLTLAQVRELAREDALTPPDDEVVTAGAADWSWALLRPLRPVGDDAVAVTGVIEFTESYTRKPTDQELPYYTVGFRGYTDGGPGWPANDRESMPLLDQPMRWRLGGIYGRRPDGRFVWPMLIEETRTSWLSVTAVVDRFGFVANSPRLTGSSSSRSVRIPMYEWGNRNAPGFNVFRRVAGGYDVFIPDYAEGFEANDPSRYRRYEGDTFDTRHFTSPNGWRVAIEVPQVNVGTYQAPQWVDDPTYLPILVYADRPDGGASAPARPQGAPAGWTPPPNDIDYNRFWRGLPYWNRRLRRVEYQEANNYFTYAAGASGSLAKLNPHVPDGPYAREGARRWWGRGTLVIAAHADGGGAAHPAGGLVPGVNGPGGSILPHAEPTTTDPVTRLFAWPERSIVVGRTQKGAWSRSLDGGRSWARMVDLGAVEGTRSVTARFRPPPEPE